MLDWLADSLPLIMFVTMFFIIFCGYPVAFVMGGTALVFAWFGWLLGVFPFASLSNILLRMWGGVAVDPVLVSVPMFIFMGSILERSGSAKDMRLATGTIASAGTLGILIPPAIMLVVMAEMLNTSAGALFAAATIPGFLLSGMYTVYILVVALLKPAWAP